MYLTWLFIYFAFRVIITLFLNLQRFLQKILTYKQKGRIFFTTLYYWNFINPSICCCCNHLESVVVIVCLLFINITMFRLSREPCIFPHTNAVHLLWTVVCFHSTVASQMFVIVKLFLSFLLYFGEKDVSCG